MPIFKENCSILRGGQLVKEFLEASITVILWPDRDCTVVEIFKRGFESIDRNAMIR